MIGAEPLPIKALNVVFCGECTVGKSSIIRRFVQDEYKTEHVSTAGMDHVIWNGFPQNINVHPEFEVKLNIWDGGGKEHYRTSLRNLHAMADVICFTFDLTNVDSLDAIQSQWLECARWTLQGHTWSNHERRYPVIAYLIGNKCDLIKERVITREAGESIAKSHGMRYFEMSAKDKQGIDVFFQDIITYAYGQNEISRDPVEYPEVDDDDYIEYKSQRKCCCIRRFTLM